MTTHAKTRYTISMLNATHPSMLHIHLRKTSYMLHSVTWIVLKVNVFLTVKNV